MTEIDTAAARRIHATADDTKHGDCHTARAVLTGMMPNMLNEIDRLRAENQRLKLVALTADRESMELEAENQRLREAVDEVRELIKESGGVWGLHRNGDDAPWSDLLPGGRYETWLLNIGELAGLPESAVESTGGGDG